MSKLTYEDKINIYEERKSGKSISYLSSKYNVRADNLKYLIRLIDRHGYNVIKTIKNKRYTIAEKERIINRVLQNNESTCAVSIDEGLLSNGILFNWIKKYKENGYNIVERKRGRSPTIMKKQRNNR